ncbi:MAG TPA: Dabb family protein [Chloroflexi bacterium]|nr:Dabb family protein [Chloroflexota bacterium]
MIKHIVMWKLYDQAEGFSRAENARRIQRRLEGMGERIEVLRALEAGVNLTAAPDAFDVALYAEFDSLEDLAVYQAHPEHLKFKEFIHPLRAEKRLVDYEV